MVKVPVNTAAKSGIMKIGGGFANLEEFSSSYNSGISYKKVKYMDDRNRYCMICCRAAAVNKQADKHCCSKKLARKLELNCLEHEGKYYSRRIYE
ncbi:hypothetical protein TNCT_333351 [Trichonephila clavata]|uniref:Uncharacterized protein n=1 Tax=Trichonephila clavata TaxID=2740835 RepID=A0A8X6KCM0_TRICU|nr:hypothetical protein TNCT_333351 [Trichonephila clavata]